MVPQLAANQEPPVAHGLAVSKVLLLACVGVSQFLGDVGLRRLSCNRSGASGDAPGPEKASSRGGSHLGAVTVAL